MALRETSVEVNILGNIKPLQQINDMIDNITKQAQKMGSILDQALKPLDSARSSMSGVSNASNSATQAMNNAARAAGTASGHIQEMGQTAATADQHMSSMTHSMHGMGTESATLSQRIHANMGDIMMAGMAMTAAGYGVGKAVGYTVKSAADFDQAMADAKSVMDPTDVKKYSSALSDLAIQQGIKTKYSATEAAQAEGELAKAGLTTSQIMQGGLAGALSLATAGDLNLTDAANIASTALNTFHDRGMTVAKAADILAGAANASATDVNDLKFSLSMAGTVAASVGLSMKDTAAGLAVMAQNGLKGSDAGTSLKQMLMNLTPMTNTAYNEFENLGLMTMNTSKAMQALRDNGVRPLSTNSTDLNDQLQKLAAKLSDSKVGSATATKEFVKLTSSTGAIHSAFYNTNGQIKSMSDIAQILQSHLHNLNSEQRQQALYTIFGSDAIRSANILYQAGAKGIDSMATSMSKIKAADVAKQKMDTFKGSVEQLRGSAETMGIAFGNLVLPSLTALIGVLTNVINFMIRLPAPIKIALIVLTAFTAAALIGTGALIGLGITIAALRMTVATLAPSFMATTVAAGTSTVAVGGFGAALSAALWPVTLIVLGVAALAAGAYLVIKNWSSIKTFFSNLFNSIFGSIMKINAVRSIFNTLKSIAVSAFSVIRSSVGSAMSAVSGVIVSGLRTVQSWWKSIWPQLSTVLRTVFNVMKTIVHVTLFPLFLAISIALGVLKNSWRSIWNTFASAVKLVFDIIVTWVKVGWHLVSGIITVGLDLLTGKWGKAWTDLKNMVGNIWNDLKSGFKTIMGDMLSLAVNGAKAIGNGLVGGIAGAVNGVSAGINWILDKVSAPKKLRIPYWTPPKFANGTDGAPGGPSILGDGGKNELFRTPAGQMGLSPAQSTLYDLPRGTQVLNGDKTERLLGALPHFAGGVGSWISNAASSVWNGVKSVGNAVKNTAVDAWSYLSDPGKMFNMIVGKFVNMNGLTAIPVGIINGMIDKVKSGIGNFFNSIMGSLTGGGGSTAVKAWVAQALKLSGAPASWTSALETIAMKESGGNPRAVNGWDSNAKAGHPSMGLMQTIQSTFNAYAQKGHTDILNPVDNIIAAIGYIKARYGTAFNVPGIVSMMHGGAYKGYATGGVASQPQVASLAEHRYPEYVISTEPALRNRSLGLYNQLGQALGIQPGSGNTGALSQAYAPDNSQTMTYNRSNRSIVYSPQVTITVDNNNSSSDGVRQAVKDELDKQYTELKNLYEPEVAI
ncbi:phage tail tape measure protein [Sporolactobacillus pectinivorans]|uniref:phage tail tape measure protein n=1 Tax=Sporolactobacillus pectinivorans TaxID=1591408 RepID=UPI000C25AB49|nr:phage tail tape measure protein [Sporolactobacillus pectinivorans]